MITFYIPGNPQGKARPRLGRGKVYTPKKTVDYESLIKVMAYNAMKRTPLMSGPVYAEINIYMLIPNSWSKKEKKLAEQEIRLPTVKPDLDNIIKVIFDAINGIVYIDDNNIYDQSDATLKILERLGGTWGLLSIFGFLPKGFRNYIYRLVAIYRYRIFGKRDTCRIPTEAEKERFLP